jgi:hypothetical protein
MSVTKIISLKNIFNFKESEKRLTMDSTFFLSLVSLARKSIKVTEENSPRETNLPRHTFFYYNLQVGKRVKLMPIDVLLDQFNECEGTRSLNDLFNFRESENRLTMDFVGVPFS